MKSKTFYYDVAGDVTEIECDVYNAHIIVCPTDEDKYCVEFPAVKNIRVGSGENGIYINHTKRYLFDRAPQDITIKVPSHVVPSLKVSGKHVDLEVTGGIYSTLVLNGEQGEADVSDCAFESVEILGESIDAWLENDTVKSALFIKLDKGNAVAENTFVPRIECRIRRGNVGVANLTCRECVLETDKGNIAATVCGSQEEFNTSLVVKEGTLNRESVQIEGAEKSFKAYSGCGNIALDFIEQEKAEIEEPLPVDKEHTQEVKTEEEA